MIAVYVAFAVPLLSAAVRQPGSFSVTRDTESHLGLSWQDTSSGESGFEIRRSLTGPYGAFSVLATTGANANHHDDAGLNASTEYCYKIAAFEKSTAGKTSYSTFSPAVCATTFRAPAPAAPSNASALPVLDSRIDVSWQHDALNGTGFEIHRSADGPAGAFSLLSTTGADVRAQSDTAVDAATQYCYKVRAFITSSWMTSYSEFSAAACATTAPPSPPTPPSNARVVAASHNEIDVFWADDSVTESGFEVHRSSDGAAGSFAFLVSAAAGVTGRFDIGLIGSTQYCYKVRAFRMGGGTTAYSDFSNIACATTLPPRGLRITIATTGVDFDADGYQVDVYREVFMGRWYLDLIALPVNGTVTFAVDTGGDYTVEFRGAGMAANCEVTSATRQTVAIAWGGEASVGFEILCSPPERLAFVNTADGNAEIYTVNSNSTGSARLTVDPSSDAAAAWSPDGTKIAFQSDRSGFPEIYVMNADGSAPVQVTATGGSFQPSWSPDGTRIAFVSAPDGNSEIYVINVDGTGLVNLTNDPAEDSSPAWSPDGAKLAFQSDRGQPRVPGIYLPTAIYLMNPDGSAVTRLTREPPGDVIDEAPAWSPDGAWLAISRSALEWSGARAIWRLSAADGSGLLITAPDGWCTWHGEPAWSPDGGRIAFTEFDGCGNGNRVNVVRLISSEMYTNGVVVAEGSKPSWHP